MCYTLFKNIKCFFRVFCSIREVVSLQSEDIEIDAFTV